MKRTGKDWLVAALIRALRTMAQTALSMLTVGMAIKDVDWVQLISISIVAGIISILTSFATGLPEVTTEGSVVVDTEADSGSALLGLKLDGDVDRDRIIKMKEKGIINLKVM
jgi:hypothetical protein